jgi:hypothetical protein
MRKLSGRAALAALCGAAVIATPSFVFGVPGVTISGNVKYTGRTGAPTAAGADNEFASRAVKIEIFDKNSTVPDQKIGEGWTDDTGAYAIGVAAAETDPGEAASALPDVYIKISPESQPVLPAAGGIKIAIKVVKPGGGDPEAAGDPYSFSSVVLANLGANATINKTFAATGDLDQSFSAYDAFTSITRYHSTLPGTNNNSVVSTFPTANDTSNFSGGRMHVLKGDRYDWDVIGHEYGHYVQSLYGIAASPGGQHSSARNLRYQRPDLTRDQANKLAWGEGWATYFSLSGKAEMNVAALGVQRAGDVLYNDNDDTDGITAGLTYSLETQPGRLSLGEDNELAVARIMWDLYDTHNESADRDVVTLGDKELFTLVKANSVTTLSKMWDALHDSTPDNEERIHYGAIFQAHNVSPQPDESTANGTWFPQFESPPEFKWAIPQGTLTAGGAQNQPLLNGFTLKFFDADYDEISVTGLGDLGNVTSWTPNEVQWADITGAQGWVHWVVLGKDDRDSVTTGYYWSDELKFEVVPEPVGIALVAGVFQILGLRRRRMA